MKLIPAERLLTVVIAISALPFLWLLTKANYSLLSTNPSFFWPNFLGVLANVLGFIGALSFFWQILLGTRHVTKFISENTIWTNKLHRQLGTYGVIFVLAHPLLETYSYLQSILWPFEFSFSTPADYHISLGRIALILFLIIWITSAIIRGKIKFRPWKYLHYLAYPLMAFVFLHADDLGTYLASVPFIHAIWNIMLAIYIALIVIRLAIGGGLWKKTYTVTSIEHVGDSIIILKIKPRGNKITVPKIGQYAYLQKERFKEAHPFTVMDFDPATNELTFGIRTFGPFTKMLTSCAVGSTFFVDGPYGVFTLAGHNEEPKVVIAGGIGITPFIRLASTYGKGMTLIYGNRTASDAIYPDRLKASADRFIEVIDDLPKENPDSNRYAGRLNAEKIQRFVGENDLKQIPFFVCGSPVFIKIMKETLHGLGVPRKNIYAEELGFL